MRAKPRVPVTLVFLLVLGAAAAVLGGILLWQSRTADRSALAPTDDADPVHVHALGINPADGTLYAATHTGLFRITRDGDAERVADRYQDTMGFTVVGPNHFLGSGHPDLGEAREKDLPPLLGLIESIDAGETWKPISLLGAADFHVLRTAGGRVYGYDASNDRLLVSTDDGRSWDERDRPAPLIDLAVDPGDPLHIVATTTNGLYASRDGGLQWTRLADTSGLLAWPTRERLYVAAAVSRLFASDDGGRSLRPVGDLRGEPAALHAQSASELYVALHDGTIKRSTDGGANWTQQWSP
jgi:hypothetical protein